MLKLKKGDTIKYKDDDCERKVVLALDGVTFLGDLLSGNINVFSDSEIEANFILPKEKWVPRMGERYWYFYGDGDVSDTVSEYEDKKRIEFGNCFQTEAEAQKVVEEIKKLLAK